MACSDIRTTLWLGSIKFFLLISSLWVDCFRDIETVSEHGSMKYDDLVEVFKSNKTVKNKAIKIYPLKINFVEFPLILTSKNIYGLNLEVPWVSLDYILCASVPSNISSYHQLCNEARISAASFLHHLHHHLQKRGDCTKIDNETHHCDTPNNSIVKPGPGSALIN